MGNPSLLKRPIARVHVVFILIAVAIGLWAYIACPGVYHGRLHGSFSLMAEETGAFRWVTVEADSAQQWAWSDAPRFAYPLVRIRVKAERGTKLIEVLFPVPRARTDGHEEILTPDKFALLLTGDERGIEGQAKELYAFVKAIGQGTVEAPRHHPYHVDKPYQGSFTHFALGTPAFGFLVGAVAACWAVTAVGLWLAKRRQKPTATH